MRTATTREVSLLLPFCLLPGCFVRAYRPWDSPARPAAISGYEQPAALEGLEVKPLETTKRWRKVRLEFPSARQTAPENDRVCAIVYFPARSTGPVPAVLIFPILRGGQSLSEGLAQTLAESGMVALSLQQKRIIFRKGALDLRFTDGVLRQAVVDARVALDWLQQQPEVDRDRLACAGISMGGMLACMLHGVDDRIRASVWMLAGGDVVDILAHTREPSLRRTREKLFAEMGLTQESFVEKYHGQLADPLDVAGGIDPAKVLIVNATFDRVVPKRNRRALWDAAGRPERRHVPLGHFSALLAFPLAKRWVVEFLWRKLGPG